MKAYIVTLVVLFFIDGVLKIVRLGTGIIPARTTVDVAIELVFTLIFMTWGAFLLGSAP